MADQENTKELQKLLKFFNPDKVVSPEDIEAVLSGIIGILSNNKTNVESLNTNTRGIVQDLLNKVGEYHKNTESIIAGHTEAAKQAVLTATDEKIQQAFEKATDLLQEVKAIKSTPGEDGKDADEDTIVQRVLDQIKLPEYKETVLDDGGGIIAKINALDPQDSGSKIDARFIKGLPDWGILAAGSRFLANLQDVVITNPTDGQILAYNAATGKWENGAAASSGLVVGTTVITGAGDGQILYNNNGVLGAEVYVPGGVNSFNGRTGIVTLQTTDVTSVISLTTTGTSGAATFNATSGVLNIPQYAGATYLAGTGLTLTGSTFSVNTTQNITTLSNLTVAGFVQATSGGVLSSATLTSGQVTTALGFTPYNATNPSGYISNVTGLITAGTNVTITGSGTSGSPYVINASGGASGVSSVASADGSITVTNPTTTVDLAVVKAPKLSTGRTISITGDITYTSASFDGSGNVTGAGTLATVNSNVGSFAIATITVNAKGLVTAASAASTTGSGNVVLATSPTITGASLGTSTATTQTFGDNSTNIATTAFVQAAALGQDFKQAVTVATTGALTTYTYNNGSSGVGATITLIATGVIAFDGTNLTAGMRVLVKNETSTNTPYNGIYTVTVAGALGVALVLTRATDFNQSGEIDTGDSVFVASGTTLGTTTWAYNGANNPTMGTTNITFAQTAGQGSFTGGNGIVITGVSIAIDTTVTVDKTTAQALTNKDLTGAGNTFPTFNQNTTGSAAKWTTARNLAGNSVDGSANVAFANKFIVQGTADSGLSAAQFLGALATGILKNTTTTGVLSIAVAGDFPTLNQNTTGSAATLTTPRAINGTNFDGSAPITITAAAGTLTGTTLNSTVVTSSLTSVGTITAGVWNGTPIALANGGTGQTSAAAAYNALSPMTTLGDIEYESATNTASRLAGNTTTTKKYLQQTGNGTVSAAPVWATIAASELTGGAALTETNDTNVTMTLGGTPSTALLTAASMTLGWTGTLAVSRGGVGVGTLAAHGVLIGNGASAVNVTGAGTAGQVLTSNGASADPTYQSVTVTPRNIQVLQGNITTSGRITGGASVGTTSISFGANGINIGTGSGAAAAALYVWQLYDSNTGADTVPIFTGSPNLGASFTNGSAAGRGFTTTNTGTLFLGIGQLTVSGGNLLVFTAAHIGIKMIANGSNVTIYATQADGTTENVSSAICTVALFDVIDFAVSVNGTTSATYTVYKNRVAQTPVTLTTNLPTSSVLPYYGLSFDNANGTGVPNIVLQSAFYQ